ncbi:MAG: hypothetical protein Q8O94_02605 [bacterium]|nr:hypothetical protein [bacterium]
MRVYLHITFLFVSTAFVWGVYSPFTEAGVLPFVINKTTFSALPSIPNTGTVAYQTALRSGDKPVFQVQVHSIYMSVPAVSVDLSQLGVSSPTTTPARSGSPDYNSNSYYNFGPFSISSDISDGLKTVLITATDTDGHIATTTGRIAVDNAKPTFSLTSATFATTSPTSGDAVYISGTVNGTGTAVAPGTVSLTLLDADQHFIDQFGSTYYILAFRDAFASSATDNFSNAPLTLLSGVGLAKEISSAVYLRVDALVYDEAGNLATSSITVPMPKTAPSDPCATPGACASNVLFLPGIEGSRLYYRGAFNIEHQIWEPDYHTDIPYLAMNADGTSKYPLYTKDIIDNLQAHNPLWSTISNLFGNDLDTYNGFETFMDSLVASSTIKEWKAYPYDWRYDVRDIVQNGTPTEMPDGTIQQVYLKDVLDQLVASSTTKKVTIVAHSNGGLLAKALVLALGADASKYIDRIIMVGTPQWGTPVAIGTMLHGDDGTNVFGIVSSSDDMRAASETMPGPYGLLPSSAYFEHITDPVVTFDISGLLSGKYATSFASAPDPFTALTNFLKDIAGLNAQAGSASGLRVPLALPSALVDKATATHSALDSWTPPEGISVTAIAGWGQDTVKTLAYTTVSKFVCTNMCVLTPMLQHTPVTTQDGDSTVVSPSAVGNIGSGLYFNALDFVHNEKKNIEHQNLTSAQPVQNIIADLLQNKDTGSEQYISVVKPPNEANSIKLRISSHSPVNLVVTDSSGNKSGVLPIPGTDFSGIKRDIPDSSVQVFDDEEYISVPQSGTYRVVASGYSVGSATLAVETIGGDGVVTATTNFADIPTTESSTATFSIVSGVPTAPAIDITGDGTTDFNAVSSSPTADPLLYVRYMKTAIGAMTLSKDVKHELDERLSDIERQLVTIQKKSDNNKKNDKEKEKKNSEKEKKDKEKEREKEKKDDNDKIMRLVTSLAQYVEQQATLSMHPKSHEKDSKKGITATIAEIILGMINQLKTLL